MRKLVFYLLSVIFVSFSYAQKKESQYQIKTFNTLKERSRVKYNFVPMPSYDPSTKLGLTAMNLFNYYPNKLDTISPASMGGIGLSYTTNNSWFVGLGNTLYLKEDTWRVTTRFIYGRMNQELDLGYENDTDAKRIMSMVTLKALRKIYKRLYMGVGYTFNKVNYEGNDATSQEELEDRNMTGKDGNNGLMYILTEDTRDNVNYPYKGFYVSLKVDQYFAGTQATA